jgi:hypothetical protein
MKSVQVGVFKSEFSDILQQVKEHGQSFVIEYGKNHKKVAMLVPYQESLETQAPRQFGILKNRGSFTIENDFEMTDDELIGHE